MTDHITLRRAVVERAWLALNLVIDKHIRNQHIDHWILHEAEEALRAALDEPERKRRTVKKRLTDDGWKRTREICS